MYTLTTHDNHVFDVSVFYYNKNTYGHPSFFGLHFSLAPDRDPLQHIALPLDRYRNRDRYRVSFHFDYDCDPDFDFDGASQKSVNYFRGTMKDAHL